MISGAAENASNGGGFHLVVEGGSGSMGIDVVNVLRFEASLVEGLTHGRARAFPVWIWRGHVVGVCSFPCTQE